jgi:hypothetical protein
LFQRLAFQQLHGDEGLAFVLVNVVDGADVRMIERRRRASFALGAFPGHGVDARALTRPAAGGPPSPLGRGL